MELTAPGAAGIAVVRLAGPGVLDFLARSFSKTALPSRCVYGNLTDGDRVIDDAVVVLCDHATADLNLHGGAWVVRSVLELAERHGFQVLRQQPTTPLPAEMVDADCELEREVLGFVPLARTETGARVLLAQQDAWRKLRSRHAIANSGSAGPSPSRELELILADRTLEHLLFTPTVAIVGPANVGKSTLANQLFAQRRSITADLPGTTRDWVGEFANIDGLPVLLVDTPGLRPTEDPIEQTAIERSREQIAASQLVVLVLDASRPLPGEQQTLHAQFADAMLVLNKIDLRIQPGFEDWSQTMPAIRTVATSGQGVDELRQRIIEHFCQERTIAIDRPRVWTERQREIIRHVLQGSGSLDEL